MLEFVQENFMWMIIAGVAIIMIIVGYIADKTDFGRKPYSKKKNNVEPIKEENNVAVEETINPESVQLEDSFNTIPEDFSNMENSDSVVEETTSEVSDTVPTETATEEIDQSLFEPLPNMDGYIPEEETSSESEENKEEKKETSEEDVWKF